MTSPGVNGWFFTSRRASKGALSENESITCSITWVMFWNGEWSRICASLSSCKGSKNVGCRSRATSATSASSCTRARSRRMPWRMNPAYSMAALNGAWVR
ncbi:hypothetical protein D3C71_1776430 [compost metagenome]